VPAAEPATVPAAEQPVPVPRNYVGSLALAVVVGAGLALTARAGAVQLLVAIAVLQLLVGLAIVFGLRVPGRKGALLLAAAAAAASDVAVSVWPHGRLGTLLAVAGLAVPLLFVHQLLRGAARVRIVESLGSIALLVICEIAAPSLLQLRHEFSTLTAGGDVVFGVSLAAAGGLVIGYLVDLVFAAPRFDVEVPRGLLGVLASAGLGGSVGYLTLHSSAEFPGGRGAFAGAAVGVLVGLFAVGIAFVEHDVPPRTEGFGLRIRPVLGVVVPISIVAPVAFLLCLSIRA